MTFESIEQCTFAILEKDELPYHLLLMADETTEAIHQYIFDSKTYALSYKGKYIAIMALLSNNKAEIEVKNIAVSPKYRRKGIATYLLQKAEEIAIEGKHLRLVIGTGDQSKVQLELYESLGFERYAVKENFFVDNYPTAIYENGKQLKDMVMLHKKLL